MKLVAISNVNSIEEKNFFLIDLFIHCHKRLTVVNERALALPVWAELLMRRRAIIGHRLCALSLCGRPVFR